jgi:transposase
VLSFLSNTRVYLAAWAIDLRKSFDTLAGVVRDSLSLDPLSGHLFVFTNSRKTRVTRGTTTEGCVDQGKLAAWTRMRVYPC